jgi:hypothetical protein
VEGLVSDHCPLSCISLLMILQSISNDLIRVHRDRFDLFSEHTDIGYVPSATEGTPFIVMVLVVEGMAVMPNGSPKIDHE